MCPPSVPQTTENAQAKLTTQSAKPICKIFGRFRLQLFTPVQFLRLFVGGVGLESQQTHVGVGMGYRDRFERRL